MTARGTLRELVGLREFRAMWIGSTVSTAGDQLAAVALSLLVFERTRSVAATALTWSLTLFPPLISGPLLGWVADRFPRRTVMVTTAWLQAAFMAAMAIPGMPLWAMIVLLVVVLAISSPYLAAQEASLPHVLPPQRYDDGVALFGTSVDIAQMAGLAAAGFLVAHTSPGLALAVNAVTFAALAILVQTSVKHRPAADPLGRKKKDDEEQPRGVLTLMVSEPRLRTLLGVRLLAGLAMVPEGLAIPLAASLNAVWAVGLILAIEPAANVLGVALLFRLVRDPAKRERLIGPLAILSLAPLILFAFNPNLTWTIVLLVFAGIGGAYHTPARSAWMRLLPDQYRGRAYGIGRAALRSSQGGGMALAGVVASSIGSVTATIAGAGGIGLLLATQATFAWRRARGRDDTKAVAI
ncbi:MFS transporter [Lentzea flaviverrucosa]|uniref:Predicted arabinose efflux permease, MFS family n=1 Tax=Lentzea flaviverrucosa TaxID=200379 RepID=A0A1H9X5X3_9PSEU|nr:MFS transporter [Lentzea flaviverrucosa]RDI20835.1 putative MFS family arabinose efflux permease [Lentzea flaviverrucosa]SES41267.1 Predicted arabinose efflux permease, MFS family [Lentzea flaviverrucosa]